MDNNSIELRLVSLVTNYQRLIVNQLQSNELVGEYLNRPIEKDVRLLCQMRVITFLVKTAPLLDGHNIALAEKLYQQTEQEYFKQGIWLQKLNNAEHASLYSYAFVMLAQSYLYKATKNQLYAIALAETFSLVEKNFKDNDYFKPLTNLTCLEQNSAMHLFEALSFAYCQADAVYMQNTIINLQRAINNIFWQPDKRLLAEKVTFDKSILSYEAGHWFEWVSLLWRVKQYSIETVIDPNLLYQSALKSTTFTAQNLVLNEMDAAFNPMDCKQIRIWPNLEYLRAKTLVTQQLPAQEISAFIALFFDQQGLPIEYLGAEINQSVKSTTGYHLAESFVDMLDEVSKHN